MQSRADILTGECRETSLMTCLKIKRHELLVIQKVHAQDKRSPGTQLNPPSCRPSMPVTVLPGVLRKREKTESKQEMKLEDPAMSALGRV